MHLCLNQLQTVMQMTQLFHVIYMSTLTKDLKQDDPRYTLTGMPIHAKTSKRMVLPSKHNSRNVIINCKQLFEYSVS